MGARTRRTALLIGAVVVVVVLAGAAYARARGWLTEEFIAASRSCGDLVATQDLASSAVSYRLRSVADAAAPTALVTAPDGRRYLAERDGRVLVLDGTGGRPRPVLDLRARVATGDDQGLLGLALSPDGSTLYAWFPDDRNTGRLMAWSLGPQGIEATEGRELLTVGLDTVHHNGGGLAVTGDGSVLLGVGDGGLTGDPGGHAQDPSDRRGKVLRIDPADGSVEVVALGLRNPYRLALDGEEGVWITDVGHECMEEVTWVPGRADPPPNLGWNRLEGTREFLGSAPEGHVPPTYAYPHDERHCAVIGGAWVAGRRAPRGLDGTFVFGDYCSDRLVALRPGPTGVRALTLDVAAPAGLLGVSSDPDGRLYVLSVAEGVQELLA